MDQPVPAPRGFVRALHGRDALVQRWLMCVWALVFAMVIVGGITRLTESGLSITRWQPIAGILPPLSEAAWQAELEHYRASPQYREVNAGMQLPDFKRIAFGLRPEDDFQGHVSL